MHHDTWVMIRCILRYFESKKTLGVIGSVALLKDLPALPYMKTLKQGAQPQVRPGAEQSKHQ